MTTDETNGGAESSESKPNETRPTVEPGTLGITVSRIFDAPRERVFEANVDPDSVPRWWRPRQYTTVVDAMDVRPGDRWRFINRDADGDDSLGKLARLVAEVQ